MGVTTKFFSATEAQLERAAPGWVRAKYGALRTITVLNPFNHAEQREISQWECLSAAPESVEEDDRIHTLVRADAIEWKLPGDELSLLMRILVGEPSETEVAVLRRPALLSPPGVDHWVFDFPDTFVDALVALTDAEADTAAEAWRERLGWEGAPNRLLDQMRVVAKQAKSANARMLTYVSL